MHHHHHEDVDVCGSWREDLFKIRHPKYVSFDARLSSFDKWPKSLSYLEKYLAESGLFYTGRSDEVKCFSCGVSMKNWNENEQPAEHHVLWQPKCDFLIMTKGDAFIQQIRAKYVVKPE